MPTATRLRMYRWTNEAATLTTRAPPMAAMRTCKRRSVKEAAHTFGPWDPQARQGLRRWPSTWWTLYIHLHHFTGRPPDGDLGEVGNLDLLAVRQRRGRYVPPRPDEFHRPLEGGDEWESQPLHSRGLTSWSLPILMKNGWVGAGGIAKQHFARTKETSLLIDDPESAKQVLITQ